MLPMNDTMNNTQNHMEVKQNYVNMLECSDGSYYTGWTTHLRERVQAHNNGNGAKYTRSRRPVHLVYFEICPSRSDALKREYAVKHLTRAEKEQMAGKAAEMVAAFDSREVE